MAVAAGGAGLYVLVGPPGQRLHAVRHTLRHTDVRAAGAAADLYSHLVEAEDQQMGVLPVLPGPHDRHHADTVRHGAGQVNKSAFSLDFTQIFPARVLHSMLRCAIISCVG